MVRTTVSVFPQKDFVRVDKLAGKQTRVLEIDLGEVQLWSGTIECGKSRFQFAAN